MKNTVIVMALPALMEAILIISYLPPCDSITNVSQLYLISV
jgi:hypothetical protein